MRTVIQMLLVGTFGTFRLRARCMVHYAALVRIEEAGLLADAAEARRIVRDSNALVGHEAVCPITVGITIISFTFLLAFWLLVQVFLSLSCG